MKQTTRLVVLCMLMIQFSFTQEIYKRVIFSNPSESTIHQLDDLGIDMTCGAIFTDQGLTIELFDYQLDNIEAQGIPYTVLIEDMQKFYSDRAKIDLPKARSEITQEKAISSNKSYSVSELINNVGQYNECDEIDWAVPTNWNLNPNASPNSFGGCLTYTQVLQELDDMRAQYPNLISARLDASISTASPATETTLEGRTVYYVRISDNPDTDEASEPETLYTSLVHSREAATVMNQLFFMWYILENYSTDTAIQNLVNNQELYFIPVFNPDGFVYNQTAAPDGGGGQRKNRRTSGCGGYSDGIDLNRNSAYFWDNGGSSSNSCSSTYMGASPFSEAETQIMRDFFLDHDFELTLNHHSYKNAMLHAYAGVDRIPGTSTPFPTPRGDEYSKYNHDMTKYNRYAYGPSTYISSLNSGNMNDWMLGGAAYNYTGSQTGQSLNSGTGSGKESLAWTPENGLISEGTGGTYGGFWPQPSNYLPIARRAMRMNFLAAYFSGKYANVHDLNQHDITTTSGNLSFAIENLGQKASDFTLTVTPVSGNITLGSPVTESFTAAQVLEQRTVNISYTLDAGIQADDEIEFKLVLTNDYASSNVLYEANIVKNYNPTVIFAESADPGSLTNWTSSGSWAITSDAYSGTSAIKSNSTATYGTNQNQTLQLNGPGLDLTNKTTVLIQYHAKWDLERSFDFVTIEGSNNGSTWNELCGKLTKVGAPSANNSYSGTPGGIDTTPKNSSSTQNGVTALYDGDTQDKWNMEEIVIDATTNSFLYNQSTVFLRFRLDSDDTNRKDSYLNADFEGFTFDNFKVIEVKIPCDDTNPPTSLAVNNITTVSADITWDNIPSATYDLRWRETPAGSWTQVSDLATNSYNISGLTSATDYEVEVRTKCVSTTSAWSTAVPFTTATPVPCTGASITSYPYIETWDVSIGDWTHDAADDGEWTWNAGGTTSNNTGPSDDFTGGGNYFYTEASNNSNPGPTATVNLISPCFDLTGYNSPTFSFYYHMYGSNTGSIDVDVTIDNGGTWTNLVTISGQQQTSSSDAWIQQNIDLNSYSGQVIKLRIAGNTGGGFQSDMGIDQINLTASVASSTWYADTDGDGFGDPNVSQVAASQPAGYVADNTDCDDTNAAINPNTVWYLDADGDNYAASTVTQCTNPGAGYTTTVLPTTDCDDSNVAVNPGATEICDGIDNNCVGGIDEGVLNTYYADTDGDTYGDPGNSVQDCSVPPGYVANNSDCDDTNAAVNPAAQEICDGIDNDCDGLIDDNDPSVIGQSTWYADTDGDGFGDAGDSVDACNQPAGYVADNNDCDDTDGAINPDTVWYLDADGDNYAVSTLTQCTNPGAGYTLAVLPVTDCDDSNAAVNPGATEVCDGIDNDCDGLIDDADPSIAGQATWYADTDGDGYGDPGNSTLACNQPAGFVANNTDCDDTDGAINPDTVWYLDADGDNYAVSTLTQCTNPGAGYTLAVLPVTDCDDSNAAVNPGAIEIECNGIDENCNGMADDADSVDPICSVQDITVMLSGGTVSITAGDIDNGSTDNCGIDNISVSPSTFTAADIGPNTVTLTVSDFEGNVSTCDVTVTVEEETLGVSDFNSNTVKITPNPFGSFIEVYVPLSFNNSDFNITIFDINGRIVYRKKKPSSNGRIVINGLENLEEAPYFIKVTSQLNGGSVYKKLIKHE